MHTFFSLEAVYIVVWFLFLLSLVVLLAIACYRWSKDYEELEERNKQLEELAFKDFLTGLLNRRSFENELKRLNSLLHTDTNDKRHTTILSSVGIIMLDADGFKQVNDVYGHSTGDIVLQKIADKLLNTFRESDLICRWGGEEFVVALPNVSEKRLTVLAERLRSNIEAIEYDEPGLKITASIGITCTCDVTDVECLIKKADEALYRAKKGGRNQVVCNWN